MPDVTLRYSGPLPECGFTGTSGARYLARTGETFQVAADDAPGLLKRYKPLLEAVLDAPRPQEPRPRRRPEPVETDEVNAEEGDHGEDDSTDAA